MLNIPVAPPDPVEASLRADRDLVKAWLIAIALWLVPGWFVTGIAMSFWNEYGARDWVAVPAVVREVTEGRGPEDQLDYEYRYQGTSHHGSRVTLAEWRLDRGSDRRHELFLSLIQARSNHASVTVFVNPRDPAESVVARDVPLKSLIWYAWFPALGFGLIAIGYTANLLKRTMSAIEAPTTLTPSQQLARSWIVCAAWNFLAFVVADIALGAMAQDARVALAIAIAQALGIAMVGYCAWKSIRWWKQNMGEEL